MTKRWFFESWSTKDGIAFASRYETDPSGQRGRVPLATVALSPPHWEPISVGMPLARRAERGPFQPGFFDGQGAIGFLTLAELVAVVRQAYIGGGGGTLPVEPVQIPKPMPPLLEELEELPSPDWNHLRAKMLNVAAAGRRRLAQDLVHAWGKALRREISRLAYDTYECMRGGSSPQDFGDWTYVLARMGFGHDILPNYPPWWYVSPAWVPRVPAVVDGLLFRVPAPRSISGPSRSLGDFLTWHMASRHHIERLTASQFAVLLFAAAALVAAAAPTAAEDGGNPPSFSLLVEAHNWLLRELPIVDSTTRAGAALADHFQG